MQRGESVDQQSAELTEIWHSYIQAEPVTQSQIAFYRESLTRLDDLGSARKVRLSGSEDEIPLSDWEDHIVKWPGLFPKHARGKGPISRS